MASAPAEEVVLRGVVWKPPFSNEIPDKHEKANVAQPARLLEAPSFDTSSLLFLFHRMNIKFWSRENLPHSDTPAGCALGRQLAADTGRRAGPAAVVAESVSEQT